MEQKEKIIEGARQYAEYAINKLPQKDKDGNVTYYFTGSLAMLLLNSAQSIKPCVLDSNGKTIKERQTFSIPSKSKESLYKGVRAIGEGSSKQVPDLDVIVLNEKADSLINSIAKFPEHNEVEFAEDLSPKWNKSPFKAFLVDTLSIESEFEESQVAELTMKDGKTIVVTDPLCLILYKFADTINRKFGRDRIISKKDKELAKIAISGVSKKCIRNANDFASMFNAMIPIYPNLDFNKMLSHVLVTNTGSVMSTIMRLDSAKNIKEFYLETKDLIDLDKQNAFRKFIDVVNKENENIINSSAEQCFTL